MKFSSKTKSRIIIALSLAFFLLFSVALWSVFRVRENSAFAETDATKIATALNGAVGDWKTQTTVEVGDETNENGAVVVINAAAVTDPSDKIVIRSGARVTVNEVEPSVQRELENTAVYSQIVFDVRVTVQKEAVLTFNADVVFRAGVTVEGTLVINGMAFNQNGQMLVSNKVNDYAEIKSEGVIVNGSLNNDGARGGTIAVSEGATLTVSEPTTSSYLEGAQKKEFSNHDGGALFLKAGADGASGLSVSSTVKNEGSVIYDSAISSEPVTNGTVVAASFINAFNQADEGNGNDWPGDGDKKGIFYSLSDQIYVFYDDGADSDGTGLALTLSQTGQTHSGPWYSGRWENSPIVLENTTLLSFGRTVITSGNGDSVYRADGNVNLGGGTSGSAVFTQGANELILDGGAKWTQNTSGGFTSGAKTEFLLGDNAEQSSVYTTSSSSSSALVTVGGSSGNTYVLNVYGGVSIVRNAVSASDVRGGGISLSNYSDLNLYGGKIAYNANLSIRQDGGGAGIIGNGNDISINIYGGAVTRNALTSFDSGESSADGAGISLESGSFSRNTVLTLYGGEISYNHGSDGLGTTVSAPAQAADGGGVRIHTGIFNLYGGAVSHNYTGGFGGGVIMWLSELNMTGGEISGNHAAFGGGVAMTSNTKSDRTDDNQYTSMASISGGKITGNVAAERNTTQNNSTKIGGYGGGICVGAQGYYFGSKVTLSGNVEISANRAVYGGGLAVYADNGSDGGDNSYSNSNYLEMNGGTITGNTAESSANGSGAYVSCVDRNGTVGRGAIRRSLLLLSGNASIDSSNNVSFAISTDSSNAPIQVTRELTGSGLAALVRLSSESSWSGKSIVSYASSKYVDRNKFLLDSTDYSFYVNGNALSIHSVTATTDYVAAVYDSTNTTLQNRYSTLEAAVAAAQDGQIVRVLRSATIASPISISEEKNITILPAEGEDITVGVASGFQLTAGVQALFTVSDGSLTIGSASQGSKIAFDGNKSSGTDMALVSVSNGGSFTLGENATLRNNASSGNAGAVYLGEGTSAEIRGEIADTSGKFGAIYVSNYATLTVNGATFSGRCQNEKGENYAVYAIGENSKVILDGEVNFGGAETGAVPYDGNAVYMENRITLGDNFRNAGFAIGVTFPAARTAGTTIVEIPLSFVTAWNGAPVEGYASAAEYADKKFAVANMDADYKLLISNADTTVANALVVSKSVVFVFDFTYTDGFNDGSTQNGYVTFPGDLKQLLGNYVPKISDEQLGRIHTRGDLVVLELQSGSNFPLAAFSGYAAREGYSLIRWEVNGSDTSYDYNGNIAYLDSEQEVSVRSVWVSNTYNITFDTNSVTGSNTSGFQGFGGTMEKQTIEYDDADKNLKTNAYTLVGWKFTGWNTSAAADGVEIGDGEEPALTAIATGTPAYTTGVGEDGKVRITGAEYNITLYAQWSPIFSGAGVGTENSPFLLKTVNDLYILEATVNGTAKETDQNEVYSALSDYYNTNKATDGSVDYTAEDYAGYYFKLDDEFDNASSPFTGVIGRVSTAAVAGGAHENDGVNDHLDQEDQISRAVYGTDSATTGGTGVAEGTPFKGTFDGNGRTVTLNINKQAVEGGNGTDAGDETLVGVGLFGYTDHATVRNLTLDGKVHGYAHVGGLIGYAFGGTVSDIYNKADITSGGHDVGGVVGTFYELLEAYTLSSVSSVANEGSVSYLPREGKDMTKKLDVDNDWNELEIMSDAVGVRFGGLVGAGVTLRLTGGYNLGAVTARYGVGGVVGTLRSLTNSIAEDAMITQSFNKGDIAATAGLYATYTLSSGYRQNFITAYTGGITGRLVGVSSVSYSYNSGNVSATFVAQITSPGGTIGDENDYTYVGDQMLSELPEGNYLGARGVGGVVGFTSFDVTSASQSGRMAISNVYNTGNVTSWAGVGGIAGYLAYANVTNSFNGGNVTATGFHFDAGGTRYAGGYMLTTGSDTVYAAYLGAIVGRGVSASLDATVSYNANAAYSGYTDATVQAIGDSEHNAKFGLDQNISSAIGLTSSQMRVDASGSAPSGFASTFNSTGWAFYTYPEEGGVNYSYYPQLSAFANTAGISETVIGGTAIDLAAYSKASAQIKYRASSDDGEVDTPVTDETTFRLTFVLNGGSFDFGDNSGTDNEGKYYFFTNKHYYDAGSGNWYYVFGYPVDKVDYVSEEGEAVGSSVLEQPSAPSRVGYTFAGWYVDSGFTESFNFGAIPGQNTTVYAKWEPVVYTITYENVVGVGGTWSGEYNKTFDIQTNGQVQLPNGANLERRGYEFSGWKYAGVDDYITQYSVSGGSAPSILLQDANGTNKATVPFSALTAGTLVLTAEWTAEPYTIEYRTEPTEGFADRQSATLNNPVGSYTVASEDITLPTPQKTGYTFLRWILVSIDGNTESISDAINAEHYTINGAVERIRSNTVGDFVLQAEWERNNITVYLDARGGTIENHETFGLQYDGTTGLYSDEVPYYDTLANLLFDGTKWKIKTVGLTGNTFNGWYTNSTATADTIVKSDMPVTGDASGNSTLYLYAGYETAKWTLTIDIQGNLPEGVTASVPSNAQGALKAFGFSFESGNITLSVFHGEDASPALAELVKCIEIKGADSYNFSSWEFPADKSIYNVTADFVLSAQYAQDRVTVNFVGRNGEFLKGISVGVGDAIGEENTEYDELLNDTRLTDVFGYTFEKKWTYSVGGVTQEFTLDTPVTGAIVVYAVFTPWTVNPTFTFAGDPTAITIGGLTYSFGSAFGKLPTIDELRAAYTGSEDYLGYQIDGFYRDEDLIQSVNINTAITADMWQQSGLSDTLLLNLYVKISKITYNITFSVGDGGTFVDQGNVSTYNGSYQYGDASSVKGFPVPTREGYTHTQWYVSRGGEEVGYILVAEGSNYAQELIDLLKEKQYEGALNVIAIWKINSYDVWFYAGEDGYFTVPDPIPDGVTFYSDPNTPVTTAGAKASYCVVKAEYNKVPSLPASVSAKKDGNTFNDWLTSDNTIVTAVRDDTTYPSDRPITAQWIVSSYTIVFITDGGTPVADKAGVKYGADLANELSGITTSREGYTFKGWFMDSGFQTPCPSTMPDYTLVLYAKWEINVHTLTLNITIDGVTGEEEAIEEAIRTAVENALGTTASVTPSAAGVYSVTVSGVKYGTSLAVLNSLSVTIGETAYTLDGLWISGGVSQPLDTMPDHSYEARATFTHKTGGYTVTFYLNDGTETVYYTLSGVTSVNGSLESVLVPVREGYDFVDWYDKQEGGNAFEFGSSVSGNTVLYAHWTVRRWTVTLDLRGGSGTESDVDVPYGTAMWSDGVWNALLGEEPSRGGYVFAGWFIDSSCMQSAEDVVMPDGNLTLYAGWTAVNYRLTFEYNGRSETFTGAIGSVIGYPDSTSVGKAYHEFVGWEISSTDTNNGKPFSYTLMPDLTPLGGTETDGVVRLTLVAQYEAIEYSAKYRNEDGSVIENLTVSADQASEDEKVLASAGDKTGYDFLGWRVVYAGGVPSDKIYTRYRVAEGGIYLISSDVQASALIPFDYVQNIDFYTVYGAIGYTVTLDPNAGTVQGNASKQVSFDSAYGALPMATRTGYTFLGWFTAETGGEQVTESTVLKTASDHTLYAQWKAITYTVIFIGNGASGSMDPLKVTYDTPISLTKNTFELGGYSFAGWNRQPDGSGQSFADGYNTGARDLTSENNDIVILYAQWKANEYTVTFDPNGGTAVTEQTVAYGGKVSEPAQPTREGYTFAEWTYNGTAWDFENDTMPASDIELVAQWKANEYTVRFDGDGATGSMNDQKFAFGARMKLSLNTFVKVGYDFTEWRLADGTVFADGAEFTISEAQIPDNKTVTLTAVWTEKTYTIVYEEKGGNPVSDAKGVAFLENVTLPTATRRGYAFLGWATSDDGNVVYAGGAQVPVNLLFTGLEGTGARQKTLYAVWTEKRYTVVYDEKDGEPVSDATDVAFSASVTLPTATRTGYAFLGWATSDGGNVVYAGGAQVPVNLLFTGLEAQGAREKTLYAIWEAEGYTVTVDAGDGGTFATLPDGAKGTEGTEGSWTQFTITLKYGTDVYTLILNQLKLNVTGAPYQTLHDWNVTAGERDWLFALENDLTIEAEYAQSEVTVSVVLPDGTVRSEDVTYNRELDLNALGIAVEGYTISGWRKGDEPIEGGKLVITAPVAIYAVASADTYEITLDFGDGTNTTVTVTFGKTFAYAAGWVEIPVREGYTFLGWKKDGIAVSGNQIVGVLEEGYTLVAGWSANEYTVTFYANGGQLKDDETVKVTFGTALTAPVPPEREGYTFAGWYYNLVEWDFGKDTMPASNITLVASWTIDRYTVTFVNGTEQSEAEYSHGSKITQPTAPTKKGYTFLGWFAGESETAYDFAAAITGDLTLTAKWEAIEYTISYVLNGGANGENPAAYTMGTETIVLNAPNRTGYVFLGWYDKESGGSKVTEIAKGSTGNVTLYAVWEAEEYEVTFVANGGTEVNAQTIAYGGKATQPTAPTRTGYTFLGWYAEGSETAYDFTSAVTGDLTLTAKWEAIEYTISYVLNGGTNGENPATYTVKTETVALNAPNRTGYVFLGWYDKEEGGNKVTEIAKGSTGNVTLYAVWEAEEYEVTFVANGGTEVNAQTIAYGGKATQPTAPTRTGYTFLGWYAEGSETAYDFAAAVTGDLTLTAKWEAIEYTISYVLNGGANGENPAAYTVETKTIVLNAPNRTGYVFLGWYDKESSGSKVTEIAKGSTGNVTLYAVWEAEEYEVTFVANGGTEVNAQTIAYGGKATQPTAPTRTGYTFLGWFAGESETAYDFTSAVTGDLTLTAKWEAIEYTISYVLNGGTNGENPATYTVKTETVALNAPNRTGYVFLGWYDKEEGGNKVTEIAKGSTGNVTLYAIWEAEEYTVTFVANGGTEVNAQTIAYGGKATQPTAPTRTGYTFLGWFAGESETAYDFTSAVTGDLTLTAKWEAIEYTISYVLNGGTNGENPATYTVKTETVALNAPNRTGYVFLGWYDKEEGGSKVTEIAKGSTGNVTLYAIWEAEEYEVTFVANGGTEVNAQTVAYGGTVAYAEVTRDNYMFVGWFTDEALTKQYSFNTAVTGDLTLYAKWRLQVITGTAEDGATVMVSSDVGFDDGTKLVFIRVTEEALLGKAGEGLAKNMKLARLYDIALVDAHGNSISLSQPISVGISVEGLDDPAGKYGIAHIPEEGAAEELATHVGADGRLYFFVEHFSYYAVVDIIPMTGFAWWWFLVAIGACAVVVLAAILIWRSRHVYELNYVNGGIAPQKLKESSLIDLPIPERESEVFDGWYYDEEFRDRALLTTMPKQNLILFAKWRRMTEEERAARDRKRAEAAAAAAEGYHDAEPVKEKEHKEETPKEIREDD